MSTTLRDSLSSGREMLVVLTVIKWMVKVVSLSPIIAVAVSSVTQTNEPSVVVVSPDAPLLMIKSRAPHNRTIASWLREERHSFNT